MAWPMATTSNDAMRKKTPFHVSLFLCRDTSVVLHPICDLNTRLFRRLFVANARNSGAIAVLQLANPALIRRKIHRFY